MTTETDAENIAAAVQIAENTPARTDNAETILNTPRKRGRPAKWNGDLAARQKDYRDRLFMKSMAMDVADMPRPALIKALVRTFVRLDKGDARSVHLVNAILAELLRRANLLAAASKQNT